VIRPRAKYLDDFHLFVEGFATYAERVWFLDLYPVQIRNWIKHARFDQNTIHYRGFLRVKELVERHGQEILPQIPRRWKALARATAEQKERLISQS
jgi:hypothetical protein